MFNKLKNKNLMSTNTISVKSIININTSNNIKVNKVITVIYRIK